MDIYTTKIIEYVWEYVLSMSGYVFHHALTYRAESWHGGKGWAHKVCGNIFEATLSWGQKSFRGQSALEMSYGYQIWWEEHLTRA